MPELSVSEAQIDRFEEIRNELETVYVAEYGTVRPRDAFQYLLDTYTPPDAEGASDPAAGLEDLTAINGVGEATAEALVSAGFPSVGSVASADPDALAEIKGISREQAVDIAAAAAAIEAESSDETERDSGEGDDDETTTDTVGSGANENDSPEDTLQQAMSLLDIHDERWRESSGDEPYEVDLPDGSTEAVRTRDDIKRLIFKHWR